MEVVRQFGESGGCMYSEKVRPVGKRFGFVKFKDVKSVNEMINNVWLGKYKTQNQSFSLFFSRWS